MAALIVIFTAYQIGVAGLSYRVIGYREYDQKLDAQHLAEFTATSNPTTAAELRHCAVANTATALSFRAEYNSLSNPNRIVEGTVGHCKMYSYVVAAAYNQLARQRGWKTRCRVAYGQVYWFGINLHKFVSGPFFRTHDFNIIQNGKQVYAVDAILYDYFRISTIPLRS
ncbi:hypothetical protein [Hymenobacter actinosclerus]|uniref:hypothetical protein n=1 Tax=Hymenobacter actinosclerus TaxID=82805 RepID=UPI001160BF62|nr:hypothetical protein [Hymenobacter actinosclerus]